MYVISIVKTTFPESPSGPESSCFKVCCKIVYGMATAVKMCESSSAEGSLHPTKEQLGLKEGRAERRGLFGYVQQERIKRLCK